MQLILGKESQPTNTFFLIFTQIDRDANWRLVLLHFAAIEKLSKEVSLVRPLSEQLCREARRIRQSCLVKGGT